MYISNAECLTAFGTRLRTCLLKACRRHVFYTLRSPLRVRLPYIKKPSAIFMRRSAHTRKRLVVNQRRNEGACNRVVDVNGIFCEKGGARRWAEVFLYRKTEQSELCSDEEARGEDCQAVFRACRPKAWRLSVPDCAPAC